MALPEREQRIRIAVFDLNPNTGAFREHTYTLTVGPAAATILLRHPVVVGTTLTIYNLENGRQADFVMESAPAPRHVRLVPADPAVDIWELKETTSAPPLPEETRLAREQNELGRAAIASIATGAEAARMGTIEAAARETPRVGTIEAAARETPRVGTIEAAARETPRVDTIEAAARETPRVDTIEAAAREAAACVVEAEGTVVRAVEYTHLLDAHVAEQTRTLELTQQEAMAVALRAAQSLHRELEEMADRAVLVRDRAKKLTREAADACARAAACASDLQALRADKKGTDQKLVEARRHLRQAEAAFAAVRADVARAAAASRPATAQPAEAPVAAEPVVAPEPPAATALPAEAPVAAEPVAAPEPVVAAEPPAATALPAEAPVAAEPVAAPEPVVAAEPPAATAPPAEAPVAAEPVVTAESVVAAGARRGPSLTTTQQFVAGFSGHVRWDDRRTTRRIHVRTRARIRRPDLVEILEPINVSRRGLCFESDHSYELNSMVWVALHYQEDMPDLLETPSRVVRIIPRGDGAPVRYGVHFEI